MNSSPSAAAQPPVAEIWRRLARLRVPLGFLAAGVAMWFAEPRGLRLAAGLALAVPGELLRIWASGHIDKGREITTTGPYRWMRHPLYVGSLVMAAGFVVAAGSWIVAAVVALYMGLTLLAATRTEEATLDARFPGAYTAYREGRSAPAERRFSWARVIANREYRAMAGFVLVAALLYLRSWW
jgi:protein-S-isoprenylcysteine O-methyltransferase Ste14